MGRCPCVASREGLALRARVAGCVKACVVNADGAGANGGDGRIGAMPSNCRAIFWRSCSSSCGDLRVVCDGGSTVGCGGGGVRLCWRLLMAGGAWELDTDTNASAATVVVGKVGI